MTIKKIAIIGLGYVGLPLAAEFGKKREVIGFDINKNRIDLLKKNIDPTLEISKKKFIEATYLNFTSNPKDLEDCNIFIVTVPTPIDNHKRPDLTALEKSSETVGSVLKRGDIVIYESTVYPGATEEICVPILEKKSGLIFNKDFYCGYSPERINPGDKKHTLVDIKKVTAGSTPEIALEVDELYKEIIVAGTHKAKSIKVAEAAKIIENTQRDVNIALMNELSQIFDRMDINTYEVLEAAGTKWNFLKFFPGLVGGHCIGVDPYYLTYKAQELGHNPKVILSGRGTNDGMGAYIAKKTVQGIAKMGKEISGSKVLVMGVTFKEDVEDIRNSKVVDVISELKDYSVNVDVVDPHASHEEVKHEYGIDMVKDASNDYDAIVLAVSHEEYKGLGKSYFENLSKGDAYLVDIKGMYSQLQNEMNYWSL